MKIMPAELESPELLRLFSEHDEYMMEFLGEHRKYYTPYSPAEHIGRAWIVYVDGRPAGCAAYRERGGGTGELKRVFIRPGYRVVFREGMYIQMEKELEPHDQNRP